MSEWQPIETAPKDGTMVVLHWDWEPLTVVGYFGASTNQPPGDDPERETWRVHWDEATLDGGFDEPTHWMPLPSPPNPQ